MSVIFVFKEVIGHFHCAYENYDESYNKKSGDHLLELTNKTVDDKHSAEHLEVGH